TRGSGCGHKDQEKGTTMTEDEKMDVGAATRGILTIRKERVEGSHNLKTITIKEHCLVLNFFSKG
ncbi:hypothetical protein TNCT_523561, partial [Trichonephila clavata]